MESEMSGVNVEKSIGAVDFAVFIGMLVLSSSIGIYFGYRDRRKTNSNSYYFGGKAMNPMMVALSLAVTHKSAITMIGYPSETYIVGTAIIWLAIVNLFSSPFAAYFFVPTIHRLQVSSINEYLELRFNKLTRQILSGAQLFHLIFLMASAIYIPSLALNVVTHLPLAWSIVLTTVICTFYTTLGGFKAVIWTDTLQALIMLGGSLAVFIKALMMVGGFNEVFASLDRGQRNTAFDADFDVTSRKSPSTIAFGIFSLRVLVYSFSPMVVQRITSCKRARTAQWSYVAESLPTFCISLLAIANGVVMYTYFEKCDPVVSGTLGRLDQGLPYIVMEVFDTMPGMTGFFIAAIYGGTLSTVSSAINSYAITIVEDFIRPRWPSLENEKKKITVVKITSIIFGGIFMLVTFLISAAKSNIIKVTIGITGAAAGPVYGAFLGGFLFPWINSLGVIVGVAFSYIVLIWIVLGSMFLRTVPSRVILPPIFTDMCPTSGFNLTNITTPSTIWQNLTTPEQLGNDGYSFDQFMYSIHFQLYLVIGVVLTIIGGLLVSFVTGYNSPSDLDPKLFIPLFDNRFLPFKVRKFFRFGVPELVKSDAVDDSELQKF